MFHPLRIKQWNVFIYIRESQTNSVKKSVNILRKLLRTGDVSI